MGRIQLGAFAREAAQQRLTWGITAGHLAKVIVETALDAELDVHLGYEKRQDNAKRNNRNAHSRKKPKTDVGIVYLQSNQAT